MNPKILFFDIETTPSLGYVWEKWETNVVQFKEYWHLLSFSAKWLGGKQITRGLIDYETYRKNKNSDKKLVLDLWKLFDEADILVAHNGNSFDIKKTNARFSFYNLPPPSPYKSIDTKLVAKRYFNFISNSLDDLGDMLKLGRKKHTGGFELWDNCMKGDKKSWIKMKKYNAQDVILLEKIYLHLLPYMKSTVIYISENNCPRCGSDKVTSRGYGINLGTRYRRFQCQSCGGWFKGEKSEKIMKVNREI